MVSIHRQFRLIYLIIREDWPVLRDYRARDHHQFLYCGQSRNFFVAGVRFCGLLVPYITDRQTVNNNKRVGTMANWGFDSAATVDSSTMSCLANAGAPTSEIKFILRYLDYESGVHNNLTASEASYIHSLGIAIGLIYGSIPHESLTFDDGVSVANTATSLAENLGIPTYVGIYADLGTSYDDYITADFLMGYAWQLTVNTPYHPGFYGSVGTVPHAAFAAPASMKMGALGRSPVIYTERSTLSPHGVLCAITNARNSLWWGAAGIRECHPPSGEHVRQNRDHALPPTPLGPAACAADMDAERMISRQWKSYILPAPVWTFTRRPSWLASV